MPISLCMIVKNEESCLANALDSVKNLVDEIIIIDTGSEDKTIEIAKKYTEDIFFKKFNNDFSEIRNFALEKASSDWVLVLDADEVISEKDISKIKDLIKKHNNEKNVMGFKFIQRTYMNKKIPIRWNNNVDDKYDESKGYIGWMYRGITRLFRNDSRIKFELPIHETVIKAIKRVNGKIINSQIPIHHFEFKKDKKQLREKHYNYSELLNKKIKKYKNDDFGKELELQKEIYEKMVK